MLARRLRIPRIGFDHFGVMAYCRPPLPWLDKLSSLRDTLLYRLLIGRADRVIVSSFYDAPQCDLGVATVPALLRDEVLSTTTAPRDLILVYMNKGDHQFSLHIERTLRALPCPVAVYGTSRGGSHGNLTFKPIANRAFLDDLASCRALISTAGNQLVGEALYFGKPMLVMPEDCAAQLERLGMGRKTTPALFTPALVQQFLADLDHYRGNIAARVRDGRADALALIEGYLEEFARQANGALATAHNRGVGFIPGRFR